MMQRLRASARMWCGLVGVTVLVVAALASVGVASAEQALKPREPKKPKDVVVTAESFKNLHSMTKVRDFYVDNLLGHLDKTLKVASSAKGGRYPVGTVIQLFPQEAMVKHAKGFDADTKDWEFFSLSVSAAGTQILTRGADEVVNRFGDACASCHGAADPKFDMVCENDHGCEPLPIGDDFIRGFQESDPRPLAPPTTTTTTKPKTRSTSSDERD